MWRFIVDTASHYLEFIIWGCYSRRRRHLSVLSLQFLEDKQHLGGEDCNVPKLAKLIGTFEYCFIFHVYE